MDIREDIFSNIVKNNGVIREMKQVAVTLEEVFHQIPRKNRR